MLSLSPPKLIFEYIVSISHVNHFYIFHPYELFWVTFIHGNYGLYTVEKNLLSFYKNFKSNI